MHKKIVTTVGTSLFTNKNNEYLKNIEIAFCKIKEEPASKWEIHKKSIEHIKSKIGIKELDKNYSAEIKSIELIKDKILKNNDFTVYLICTDTITSRLAAEILKEYFEKNCIQVEFDPKKDVISNLQVKNSRDFEKGIVNFVDGFEKICQDYYENLLLNITGGFKALIPFMTILGQIHKIPIYYVFEETEALIEIPAAPISFDWDLFKTYENIFEKLEKDIQKESELDYDFRDKCKSCLRIENSEVILNELGIFLWNLAKRKLIKIEFYCPDDVLDEIQKNNDIKRIIENKFHHIKKLTNKVEKKGDHFVYDDGDNKNRIFLFYDPAGIYIYKVFTDHSEYQKFLKTSFGEKEKQDIKNISVKRKIQIKEEK